MGKAVWHIRAARKSDRRRLKGFECARDGSRAQVEVEDFIRKRVLDWAFQPRAQDGDSRLLLLFDDCANLIGVAALCNLTAAAAHRASATCRG
jgi:hypothetical protein